VLVVSLQYEGPVDKLSLLNNEIAKILFLLVWGLQCEVLFRTRCCVSLKEKMMTLLFLFCNENFFVESIEGEALVTF
jgi:hypothetical protein